MQLPSNASATPATWGDASCHSPMPANKHARQAFRNRRLETLQDLNGTGRKSIVNRCSPIHFSDEDPFVRIDLDYVQSSMRGSVLCDQVRARPLALHLHPMPAHRPHPSPLPQAGEGEGEWPRRCAASRTTDRAMLNPSGLHQPPAGPSCRWQR